MVVVLVRACMFCLLCATHAHCSSHHESQNSHVASGLKASYESARENYPQFSTDTNVQLISRSRRRMDEENFIKLAFKIFGDGEKLSKEGFKKLLQAVGLKLSHGNSSVKLNPVEENKSNISTKAVSDIPKEDCISLDGIIGESVEISEAKYQSLCPMIIYHMIPNKYSGSTPCHEEPVTKAPAEESHSTLVVWFYATLSVILISACGLFAVAVIPLMQRTIYHSLLQFLVALAVGTMCGDALLHLLPHAMLTTHGHHDHDKNKELDDHSEEHDLNLWRGFIAVIAIVFFYFTEKCLSQVTEWRKRRQRKNKGKTTRVRVMREETRSNEEDRVGEKLCKHKYSSYPYCYGEIANSTGENHVPNGPALEGEVTSISHIREENGVTKHEVENDLQKEDIPCSEKQLLESSGEQLPEYTIILREHETRHHGHAHTHGHVHSAPSSLSSVAWMIIMGDGLHNLADGLAIGAAFGANVGGGISTAVAVFCHELPHEIGDFAVLLKAGMSAKQAVFYNLLSSILCFIGMLLGVFLGHNETVKPWIFSFAAGMFLYIALVDMVPELSSSHSMEGGSLCQCLLQLCGLMTGIGIMLIIALYEELLMESFVHSF